MADVNALYVDELRRAIEIRSKALESVVSDLQGSVPKARLSLHRAYNLVRRLPHGLTALATSEVDRAPDPETVLPFLQTLLRHLSLVADFVEDHLAHGDRHELSQALSDEVSEELRNLNLEFHNVVISHGEATNFTTLFGDIDAHAASAPRPRPPATGAARASIDRLDLTSRRNLRWKDFSLSSESQESKGPEFSGSRFFLAMK